MSGNSGRILNVDSAHEHYSRIPDSVLEDGLCSATARCVYAYLAGRAFQGSTVRVGQRRIATRLGFHLETVGRALRKLEARGHITIVGRANVRRIYHLHSDVFGTKQRAGIEEVISAPSGGRRLASVRREAADTNKKVSR